MPEYVHGSRSMWEQNLNGRIALDFAKKKQPFGMALKDGAIKSYQVTEEGKMRSRWYMDEMEAPFVNIMPVEGPITRNGGACSYGSADLRDWMMKAADYDLCQAHIFVINSPGGSAWAINDFKQGIDYAHSNNQKVYAFVDGLCCSAAIYLASQCDEVYYMNPKDTIGSVGVMAAFYTEKNGSYNKYTNETYHELYDPESYDKNGWYRDIAEDSKNDKKLLADLVKTGVEFRSDIQKAFPAATDAHIHGAIFDAQDVKGIFCDGQMTLGEVVLRAFAVANGSATPITRTAQTPAAPATPEGGTDGNDDGAASQGSVLSGSAAGEKATVSDASASGSKENNQNSNNPQNKENMKKYETIATACGVEELVVTEEGAHFVPDMLDQLEASLATAATEKQNAEQRATDLQTQLYAAADEKTDAVNNKEKELNEAHESVVNNLNTEKVQLEKDLADALKAKEDAEKALETANQTIKDQTAQIESLTTAAAVMHDEGAKNNGQGAAAEEPKCAMPEYDHTKSPLENARIRKAAGF